jgi:hypothetical protein
MRTSVGKGQFFRVWVTSKPAEKPFTPERVELNLPSYRAGMTDWRDLFEKYKVSQIKRQFLDSREFFGSSCPTEVSYDGISLSDDSDMIDFSGFWYYPTEITVYSKMIIESDEETVLPVTVTVNGSLILWNNGREAFRVLSERLNYDKTQDAVISLSRGRNEIVVALNELGERNTLVRFGIRNRSGKTVVTTVPTGMKEEEAEGLRRFMASLDMTQAGELLFFSAAGAGLPISLFIADENNCRQTVSLTGDEEDFCCRDIYKGHILIVSVLYEGALFRKGFYRFEKENPFFPIAETEKERKKLYIDDLIEKKNPSPALFIAGLSRGLDLYDICSRPVQNSVERIIRRADCSDFRLTEIIWMYCLGKDILPPTLLDEFKSCMLGYRYWFTEKGNDVMWFFSENHALSLHASEYIAGRLFPDEVFSNSGMTGREHMAHALVMIRQWFSSVLEYGYTEWCSVNYLPVDMLGYMTLMKFSGSEEIVSLCRRALDMTFRFYAMQCYRGMLLGANGRVYINDVLSPTDIQANSFCYFAWGTPYAPYGYKPTLYALLEEYECPEELKKTALPADGIEEHFVQGRDRIEITIVKTGNYFIGSSSSSLEGKKGDQEHLFDAMVGDEDGRFWINHPGEARVLGTRRPGYFTGNGYTPHVSQYKSSAVISFRFPDTAEVNFTHLICHRFLFEREILREKDLFLCREGVNVFIHADNGLEIPPVESLSLYELRSPGLDNTWYVRIDDTMEFEAFVRRMESIIFREEEGVLTVDDPVYGKVRYGLMNRSVNI